MHPSITSEPAAAAQLNNSDAWRESSLLTQGDRAPLLPTRPLGMPLSPSCPAATAASTHAPSAMLPALSKNSKAMTTTASSQLKEPPSHANEASLFAATAQGEAPLSPVSDSLLSIPDDDEDLEPYCTSPSRSSRLQYASHAVKTSQTSGLLHLRGGNFLMTNADDDDSDGSSQDLPSLDFPVTRVPISTGVGAREGPVHVASRSSDALLYPRPLATAATVSGDDNPRYGPTEVAHVSAHPPLQQPVAALSATTTPSALALAPPNSSSPQTTFYSGVKLAPPIVSAFVTGMEKRAGDHRVWYTIQVQPCDLLVPASTTVPATGAAVSASTSVSSTTSLESTSTLASTSSTLAIPRKSFRVYRRYEDVAEFADQLEHEFPRLGLFQVPRSDQGVSERCKPLELPRLANRLVLFVTKAVCQQRKEDLDRYLQELFALGPMLSHSRLVSEFFGIWKTDMEIHLSQRDGDPLALQHLQQQLHLQQEQQQDYHQQQAPSAVASLPPSPTSLAVSGPPSLPSLSSSSLLSPSTNSATSIALPQLSGMSSNGPPHNAYGGIQPSVPPPPSLPLPLPTEDWAGFTFPLNGLPTPHPDDLSPTAEILSSSISSCNCNSTYSHGHHGQHGTLERRRTFKKLKAFQSSETAPSASTCCRHEETIISPLCTPTEEKSDPTLSNSVSFSAVSGVPSNLASAIDPVTTASLPFKPKVMKRAKTIVFRPEVTVQPLASRHVIPPWNRIPAAGSAASGAPLSPVSPPAGGIPSTTSPFPLPFPGALHGDQMESTEAPRKPTLTHSKTMTAISTAGMEPIRRTPSPNSASTGGSRNAAIHSVHISSSARPSPATAVQSTTSQLIAPWNRQTSSSEASTNLHSLIRISNSASSNTQASENKIGATTAGGTQVQGTKLRSILKNSASQPYSALSLNATPMARTSTSPAKYSNAGGAPRKGMTHSTSAPSGTMPTLLVLEARSHVSMPPSSRNKQKRESVIGPGGKPIVGILKNTSSHHLNHPHLNHQYHHQHHYQHHYQQYLSPCSARRTSQETVHDVGGAGPNGTAIATTFKIVVDADTIVALQVLEEPDFVLSLQELRRRIINKLQKSNIVLRDDFDLAWVPVQPAQYQTQQPHPFGSARALSKRVVPLETDEHLFQAMLASPSRKVTLRCSR